jgi:hypothetical protein
MPSQSSAQRRRWFPPLAAAGLLAAFAAVGASVATAQTPASAALTPDPRFVLELEGGAVWQSRNDVEIPNDGTATRFSLQDLVGVGPWPSARLYATWRISPKHSLRALLAPFAYTETGVLGESVRFAGADYDPGRPTEATYKFNSWRVGYRYAFVRNERWIWRIGFTAKIRDAKVELKQDGTTSKDTDVGFVPLLHVSGDWRLAPRWRLLLDIEALGGGPGRAEDAALKLAYDLSAPFAVTVGYRVLEGGADVDSVYNFAWFNYAVASVVYRF